MKPKGISLIEQHCEKLFLGLLSLAALGVVAMQFTGEGNSVQVGSGGEYRLDQAYEQVIAVAESKLGQLEETRVNPNVPGSDESYASDFVAAMGSVPAVAASAPLSRPYSRIGTEAIVEDQLVVAEIVADAPTPPVTGVFLGTISPSAGQVEAFREIYGEGDWPRDERALTIETTFDARGLRELLEEDPDGDGPAQPAPVGFWRARHLIACVNFERQRLLADGEWGETEIVESPPGAMSTRELIEAVERPEDVGEIMSLIKGDRGWEIVRPSFVTTVPANWWLPPGLQRAFDGGAEVAEIQQGLRRGVERGTDLRGADVVSLWTHDYRVEPGETYRYRASVTIPNPYFGFGPALAAESKSLAEEPFLVSRRSGWGEPVTAPRSEYWFAFSATDGSGGALEGVASCRADVYVFVGGKWRHKQERFEPGQLIQVTVEDESGVSHTVSTGSRLLDVVRASLTEPDARGRQEPMQVVADSGGELELREVWRDRGSDRRRELQAELSVPSRAVISTEPEPRSRPLTVDRSSSDDGR